MKPRILVAFDFGEPSVYALAWASDLNRTTGGPPIHVVHAVDTRPGVAAEGPAVVLMPGPAEIASLERRLREAARDAGAEAEATFEVAQRPSSASATILEVAQRMDAELIVMGSHARRGLARLLLGSVAAHVARGSECPVTTVYNPHAPQKPHRNR
jgi:nucleotide-binding universal stress UspA family protein